MKLVLNFPLSSMHVDMQLIKHKGDTVLETAIYGENKQHRVVALDDYYVNGEMVKNMWGRGESRLFKGVDSDGVNHMVYATVKGGVRRYYRIDESYDSLRAQFNTSLNTYPQGRFLFNQDKSKRLTQGIVELYDLDPEGAFISAVYEASIIDFISSVTPVSITKTFPILNTAIPKLQQRGLFFTENHVYWLDRPINLMYDITHHFFGGECKSPIPRDIATLAKLSVNQPNTTLPINLDLPRYDLMKTWISPPQSHSVIKSLLANVIEYESHCPVRVLLQIKTTRKTSGRYQIPGAGTFGRCVIDTATVESLKSRMNGDSTLIMNGKRFTLLYTLTDVNAIYVKSRNQDQITDYTSKAMEEIVNAIDSDSENCELVLKVPTVNEYITAGTECIESSVQTAPLTTEPNDTPSITHIATEPLPMDNTEEPKFIDNTSLNTFNKVKPMDHFDYIFQTPIIARTQMRYFEHQILALGRVVLLQLPEPYGTLIPWTNVSGENIIDRLDIQDQEMVTFGNATFYRKDALVFMAETMICLNHAVSIAPKPKPSMDRFVEALDELVKEKSLVELINMVTSRY
jgi:hypothetical protein